MIFCPPARLGPPCGRLSAASCGNDLEFEVQLILRREEVPAFEVRVQLILRREEVPAFEVRPPVENSLCLGWHTWLKSGSDFDRNPGDTILLLGAA